MTTAADICTGAMRMLALLDATESPSAADAATCLERLNDMISGWAAQGVDTSHWPMTLASVFSLEDRHVGGVKAMLAVQIAGDFGAEINPSVQINAEKGWAGVEAEYIQPPNTTFDTALIWTRGQRGLFW